MLSQSHFPLRRWVCQIILILLVGLFPPLALADDDEDDDDTAGSVITSPAAGWILLNPGDTVGNLFRYMVRAGDRSDCPVEDGVPLLAGPLPEVGSIACGRITNDSAVAGIWRVDFEETFGADYRFDLLRGGESKPILTNRATGGLAEREARTRRLASVPVVIAAGATVELRVTLGTPSDIDDADPLFRPETQFDRAVADRSHGYGAFLGASLLLILFFVSVSRLLQSAPASRYALYFSATTLAAAANEGYVAALFPAMSALTTGVLDKGLEAAQIAAHLVFVAAFVEESLEEHWLPKFARRLASGALVCLLLAGAWSFASGGVEGALRYHDLGFELDPLMDDPFGNAPLLLAALVSAAWYATLIVASTVLIKNRSGGAVLFALGAAILVLALGGSSLSDDFLEEFGDDTMALQFALLTDAVLFAGAMVLQAFGLRAQRDTALRLELAATQQKVLLAERLETARQDRDRAQELAEGHRARLALTGHDLRQPLASLKMAVDVAERSDPTLSETLRTSLDYLSSVLNDTLTETRPVDIGPGHRPAPDREDVPLKLILDNAVRMFGDEAVAKGLSLKAESTDVVVRSQPVALIRMVSNLVANAIKYSERGEVRLRVRLKGKEATIDVCDTGPGLTDQELSNVLQTYSRGSDVDGVEGEGLGLSSVQTLARQQGLRLQIESTPGVGSQFSIAGLMAI